MKIKVNIKRIIPLAVYFALFGYCLAAEGDTYQLLAPLPNITSVAPGEFGNYISNMYFLSISLAIALAVFQLSRAGFTYLTTEAFTGKKEARGIINNALIGLGLILASYLLLNTINPDLVQRNFSIPSVNEIINKSKGN